MKKSTISNTILRFSANLLVAFSFVLSITFTFPSTSKASDFQQFLRYCTYGVVAGALIGGASLAFSDDPSGSLTPIARATSLGLYGGIAFSLYDMQAQENRSNYQVMPVLGKNESRVDLRISF